MDRDERSILVLLRLQGLSATKAAALPSDFLSKAVWQSNKKLAGFRGILQVGSAAKQGGECRDIKAIVHWSDKLIQLTENRAFPGYWLMLAAGSAIISTLLIYRAGHRYQAELAAQP